MIAPNLWTGIGLVRGSAGTALVGDPETVAKRLREFQALGIKTVIASGYMAMSAREFMQTDVVVLAILIYGLLGKLADSSVRAIERVSLAWHPAYRKGAKV